MASACTRSVDVHNSHFRALTSVVEPWLVELEAGRREAAWDAFLDRYRRLVFAAIRHYVRDHDDVMDVFTWVCEALRKDDFRRLRSYDAESAHRARFTTWLVTVVRNLAVDWLRQRDGRTRRGVAVDTLPEVQRRICQEVFENRRSHAEAYELIRSRDDPGLTFGRFLRELAAAYRAVTSARGLLPRELAAPPSPDGVEVSDPILSRDTGRILDKALGALERTDRLAVEMYVIDGLPAGEVAHVLGLPSAKAVYNRVYRALEAVRASLESAGLVREDL